MSRQYLSYWNAFLLENKPGPRRAATITQDLEIDNYPDSNSNYTNTDTSKGRDGPAPEGSLVKTPIRINLEGHRYQCRCGNCESTPVTMKWDMDAHICSVHTEKLDSL